MILNRMITYIIYNINYILKSFLNAISIQLFVDVYCNECD